MLPTLRAIEDNLRLGASLGLGGARYHDSLDDFAFLSK